MPNTSLLVAMSVLECLFFRQHGVRSVSLSYAQQTNAEQDTEAVFTLRRMAAELLPDAPTPPVAGWLVGPPKVPAENPPKAFLLPRLRV